MLKKHPFLRWLSSVMLHLSLYALIGSICFVVMLGNKQVLKDTLSSSGVYDNFVSSVIAANQKQAASQTNTLPLDDQEVIDIVEEAFSSEILETQTNQFIDDVFLWLEGENKELGFSIDFTDARDSLFSGLSSYAANRLAFLPECTYTDVMTSNVFEITCRPPGVSLEATRQQVLSDFENGEFLKTATITQNSLPKTSDGQLVQDKFGLVPVIFRFLSNSIIIFSFVMILAIALFVYARLPRRRAIKALGRDLLTSGLMLLGFTAIFGFLIPRYTETFSIQGNETSELFNQVVDLYVQNLDILIVNITLQIATIGAAILIMEKMSRPADIYKPIAKKSGIITGYDKKTARPPSKRNARPPVQSSEELHKKVKKTKKAKTNKYRKINL